MKKASPNSSGSLSSFTLKFIAVLCAIIVGFYALNWLAYGLEYVSGRRAVLHHYGGAATYACASGGVVSAAPDGVFSSGPKNLLLPALGISYSISPKPDGSGIASGYVTPFGKVVETAPAVNGCRGVV